MCADVQSRAELIGVNSAITMFAKLVGLLRKIDLSLIVKLKKGFKFICLHSRDSGVFWLVFVSLQAQENATQVVSLTIAL